MENSWRQILRTNFTKWEDLADFLQLKEEQRKIINKNPKFILNLPKRLAEKIEKGTLEDPILRQFLPTTEENQKSADFVMDPVQDANFRKESKLLQKYQGRGLLLCTSACAMHCRFCFRQNFDYEISEKSFDKEIALIENYTALSEIILSGGDPLSLTDSILRKLLLDLSSISHISRIRFHTRFPIGIPERINSDFLHIFEDIRPQIWFVIHVNHPKELDEEILKNLKLLQKKGIPVLNQSVLLKGVNDDQNTLKELAELLVNNGIMPYYMHQLDRVQGAKQFEVPQEFGAELISDLAKKISGYGVPKYVREVPGAAGKTVLY